MKVKICGITDRETAKAAVEFGADAIGFVFAESKRKVSEMQAAEIISSLPQSVMKVGVFVNADCETIMGIAEKAGLTHIQLHGDETPDFCRTIPLPVIKGMSGTENIQNYPCDYYLLDGPKGKYYGGNGVPFDWKIVDGKIDAGKKIILAGGLNEGNVLQAIEIVKPYMVDVSSGVETNGVKDLKKIERFINIAKSGVAQV